ncbi:MAG: glycerate kinase [Campylobacteraceae bacterium]
MKIIIASDSYKGSLSSLEVANAIKTGFSKIFPSATFSVIPMADGGDGTLEAMLYNCGGKIIKTKVHDPLFREINSSFGILENGDAIIEMALSSGLPLLKEWEKNALKATTYGLGELILKALDFKCKNIFLGLGGSATNDAGVGMMQALGASFLDKNGDKIGFGGVELSKICKIDLTKLDKRLKSVTFTIISDVNNPLCGKNGASAIYGPQKGASTEDVKILDKNLSHFADIVASLGYADKREMVGTGAAGGVAFPMINFLNTNIKSGIDVVLNLAKFDEQCIGASLVITGEGRLDRQSVFGKVPVGVAKFATIHKIPVVAVVGSIGDGFEEVYKHGISAIQSSINHITTLDIAIQNAKENVKIASETLARSLKVDMNIK